MYNLPTEWIVSWTVRHRIRASYNHPHWTLWTPDTSHIRVFAPYHPTWDAMVNSMRFPDFQKFTKIAASLRACLGDAAMDELLSA